jgi:hypothetical protein
MANDISRRNQEFAAPTPQLGTHLLNTRVPWKQCQNRGAPGKTVKKSQHHAAALLSLSPYLSSAGRQTSGEKRKANAKDKENDMGCRQILPRGVGLRQKSGVSLGFAVKLLF